MRHQKKLFTIVSAFVALLDSSLMGMEGPLEIQKIAVIGKEKALKEIERRERTKKLIEMGGLVAKAGIDTLDTHTLYGAFLSIKEKMNKAEALQQWSQKGANAFAKGGNVGEGIPLVVQFKEKPTDEARTTIRALGLRWNAIRQEWQEIASLKEVESVAKLYNGSVVSMFVKPKVNSWKHKIFT